MRYSRAGIRVDVDDLVAYSHVCRFPVAGTLPPTYPHLVAFPLQMAVMSGDRFPLPLLGAVHVENRIEVVRPVDVDEPLDVSVWAQDLRPHRRGRQVDLVSEVSGAWRGRVARGEHLPLARARSTPTPSRPSRRRRSRSQP